MHRNSSAPKRSRAVWAVVSILVLGLHALVSDPALAQSQRQPPPPTPAVTQDASPRSAMDALLMYLVMLAEFEFANGDPARGVEVMLDAAKRSRQDEAFRRAVQMAAQARSSDLAQQVVKTWRETLPGSLEAMSFGVQLSVATQRWSDAAAAFIALVGAQAPSERASLVRELPDLLQSSKQPEQTAAAFEAPLTALSKQAGLGEPALSAMARLWMQANQRAKAIDLIQRGAAADPTAHTPALLAMSLMQDEPAMATLVKQRIDQPKVDPLLILQYGQTILDRQRHGEALPLLERVTREHPDLAPGWLVLGTTHVELRNHRAGEDALNRFLSLTQASTQNPSSASEVSQARQAQAEQGQVRALYYLAQSAEQRADHAAALRWLDQIAPDRQDTDIAYRRAAILGKQGKLDEARQLLRELPVTNPSDARRKVLGEAGLLRDAKRWQTVYDVLAKGATEHLGDAGILYEQATAAEKLQRFDEMERLLRQAIAIEPKLFYAYNALGYSLIDRNVRLGEARELIKQALNLAPGDPFVTDSLGWLEFRAGNPAEALRVLRDAWAWRPDPEIGAHLGEVLWVQGLRDEARGVWRESTARDAGNETLQETLRRLKIDL
jgi:tetratricopeptide (TPR) repeat protein